MVGAAGETRLSGAEDAAVECHAREYAVLGPGLEARMTKLRCFLLFAFCAGLLGCDHATKLAAEHALGTGRVVTVVPSVLELRYARNHDVAFNALSQWDLPHKQAILLGLAIAVLALTIGMWIRHRRQHDTWNLGDAGYAFVVAGAFGN